MTRRSGLWGLALGLFAVAGLAASQARTEPPKEEEMKWRELTPEERRVIEHKGTEPPFSGRFHTHTEAGAYTCRRCGATLFASEDKFDARCGWPSFDQALPGAVREQPDADGRRTEIVCARCGGHLGHVFRGEGFTERDTRHCVNSISLDFTPAPAAQAEAFFAGGCFWGVEHLLAQEPGVLDVQSGYMGGSVEQPSYEQVCTGKTGHAETVRVLYDPTQVSFRSLARLFFEIHDPTQVDRQGPDRGPQYRSAVFYTDPDQRRGAEDLIEQLRRKGLKVATQVEPASQFWPAEDYHQDYYEKTGKQPYCHARVKRFGD